ncbi:MAG: tRNA (adenosine(37)-N6)-threonylcarbamoyltransferase complex dimerization subunit type 1 TsaB [Spongiibacteraceae bacterium]
MPRLLALDSSTEACSVALLDGDVVIERYVEAPREHMLRLLPMVDELLAERGLTLRDLDAIAFARGPGSFTGLRICIGVVQGLAFGAQLPVIPVSTLAALAQTGAHRVPAGTHILSAIDARMDEVYWGWFEKQADGLVRSINDEQLTAPEQVHSQSDAVHRIGVGSGWCYRPRLGDAGLATIDATVLPRASAVIALALSIWSAGGAVDVEQALPVYLRDKVV